MEVNTKKCILQRFTDKLSVFENFSDHRTCTDKSSTVGGAVCRTGVTATNTHTHKEEKKNPTLLAPSAGLHFFVDRRPVCLWTGAGTRTRTTLGPNIPHVWTLLLPHFHRRHQELCETNQATLCSPLTTSTGTSDSSVPEFRLPSVETTWTRTPHLFADKFPSKAMQLSVAPVLPSGEPSPLGGLPSLFPRQDNDYLITQWWKHAFRNPLQLPYCALRSKV